MWTDRLLSQPSSRQHAGDDRSRSRCVGYRITRGQDPPSTGEYCGVLVMTSKEWPQAVNGQVTVVERSVLCVVRDIIENRKFHQDPSILDKMEIPRSEVVNLA